MAETHLHADIPAPAAAVWPWLVEPERMVQWLEGLDGVAVETAGPLGVGSRYRLAGRYGAGLHVIGAEVLMYAPFERFVLRVGGPAFPEGVTALVAFTLSAEGSGTRLEAAIRVEGLRGLRRLAAPVAMTVARREVGLRLDILRRILEGGAD